MDELTSPNFRHECIGTSTQFYGVAVIDASDIEFSDFPITFHSTLNNESLDKVASPDIIIIDDIQIDGIEKYEDLKKIVEDFGELFSNFPKNGVLIINEKMRMQDHLQRIAVQSGVTNFIIYGDTPIANVKLQKLIVKNGVCEVTAKLFRSEIQYTLPIEKLPYINQSLAMIAAVKIAGKPLTILSMERSETEGRSEIGFMCNLKKGVDPKQIWSPSILYRAVLMDRRLKEHGTRLFIYSPKNVKPEDDLVPGYYLENTEFIPTKRPLPEFNANWTYKLHQMLNNTIGYTNFINWTRKQNIKIITPFEFTDFTVNKLETYRIISMFDPILHPKTKRYNKTIEQLQSFFNDSALVFLKPQSGNRGNDIIVLRKHTEDQYTLTYYHEKSQKKEISLDSLSALHMQTLNYLKDRNYIIQQGIDVERYRDTAFDIRVTVLHDGSNWRLIHQVRLGATGSDLSNIAHGGLDLDTEDVLADLYSQVDAEGILQRVKNISFQLGKFLDCFFSGQLVEIAFDFMIDKQQNIHLAELNSKPGMSGPLEYKDVFNILPEEQNNFDYYIKPHAKYLADYFYTQLAKNKKFTRPVWFQQVKDVIKLSRDDELVLCQVIFDSINNKEFITNDLPKHIIEHDSPSIVFISVSDGNHPAFVSYGSGHGIIPALKNCFHKLAIIHSPNFTLKWVKLDIVNTVKHIQINNVDDPLEIERSLHGIAFEEHFDIAFLPEQMLANTLLNNEQNLRPKRIRRYLKNHPLYSRSWQRWEENNHTGYFTFTTTSLFFDGQNAHQLYRGHRVFSHVTQQNIIASLHSAMNYLKRIVKENGEFIYSYLPKIDEAADRYNLLRHAGTTYAMLELYERFNDEQILGLAQRAIRYLLSHLKTKKITGSEVSCIVENGFIKLGGNALTILMLTKYTQVTNDEQYLPIMQSLAKWIVSHQCEDGRYRIHKQAFETGEEIDFTSEYYPGETILALIRLYKLDNNTLWLDSAERCAQFLITVRDKGLETDQLIHDHWLLYSLNELYRLCDNQLYLNQSMRIAEAIMRQQHHTKKELDWMGGYYNPPRSTPTATRMEGLCAAHSLAKDFGLETMQENILQSILRGTIFQLQTQFYPESVMYLPNPTMAEGGFHHSLTNFETRIDYVQHNVSALLALDRILTEQSKIKEHVEWI